MKLQVTYVEVFLGETEDQSFILWVKKLSDLIYFTRNCDDHKGAETQNKQKFLITSAYE
jgi:hypothetical protein